MKKRLMWLAALVVTVLYLMNASWLAGSSNVVPQVFSHRGVYQLFDRKDLGPADCTAIRMKTPTHGYLENTIASMARAFELGADVIEMDIHPTQDGEFVVFHDWTLDCRTNGSGVTRQQTSTYLKSLDVGYGYTADGGQSYPFRGKGVGLIPTLAEVFQAFPDGEFIINIKGSDPKEAMYLDRYLTRHNIKKGLDQESRLLVFGSQKVLDHLLALRPATFAPNRQKAKQCVKQYVLFGWTSIVPSVCKDAVFIVPADKKGWLWGWPNRFFKRMEAAGTFVLLVGDMESQSGIPGLIHPNQIADVPDRFYGAYWVDDIYALSPVLTDNALNSQVD